MAYTAEHLTSRANRRLADFDPDVTTPVVVDLDPSGSGECLPITDGYRRFLAGFFRTVGTGALDEFAIIAATDADGGGAVVVVEHAVGSEPNALGDTIWLECDIEQVRNVLATATHVGVRVEFATGTDEGVIYFERADPLHAYSGLTADIIA
jgi:hypothetical protein